MAREFRTTGSAEETFSPTSPLIYIKALISLSVIQRLLVSVFDVSDAFLKVSPKSYVVVQVPKWVQEILQRPDLHFWRLRKCLPGQRSAAPEWNQFFSGLCAEFNYEAYQGGTLFRHENSYLSVHMDDILLIGPEGAHEAFLEHFNKLLKLKAEGPHGVDRPGVVYYLKRQLSFDSTGVEIAISAKYIPKLITLLGLENKRSRGVPTHSTLDAYSAADVNEADRRKRLQSSAQVWEYAFMWHRNVWISVRRLSPYMANPTKNSINALKKLASYLQLTSDTIMKYNVVSARCSVFTRWQHLNVDGQPIHRDYVLELFSGSDRASSKSTGRSTSSGLIFLNGHTASTAIAGRSLALPSAPWRRKRWQQRDC